VEPYRDLATFSGPSGFEGAVGKIVRAKYQLRDLEDRFATLAKTKPYRLAEQFDLRPGEKIGDYRYVVKDVSLRKREWGVLIGELVHNLRSALEHTIYAAAKSPSGDTQFPIFRTHVDWEAKSGPMIHSVPEKVVAIIEEAQPYHVPDPSRHVLAILNRLSNYDKHRLLHTTALTIKSAQPGFRATRDIAKVHEIEFMHRIEEGATLVRISLEPDGPEPEVEMYGEFVLDVAFSEPEAKGSILDGLPVLAVLFPAFKAVEGLVLSIEVACESRLEVRGS
jgi:hypothetical protein